MRRDRKTKYKEISVSDKHLENFIYQQSQDALDEPESIERVRELIESLPWELKEVYYYYYGERKSIRDISLLLGFNSHWPIQKRLDDIKRIVGEGL